MRRASRALPLLIALVLLGVLAALSLTPPGRRGWRAVERMVAPERGARSGVAPMPALDRVRAWLGGPPPPRAGATPVALVVFADTDPVAPELLAAAEAWHEAYARLGVVVLGLHRPQFAFAADSGVAARSLARAGARFPVALDPALEVGIPGDRPATFVAVGDADGGIAVVAAGVPGLEAADRWLRERIRRIHPEVRMPDAPARAPAAGREAPGVRLLRLGAGEVSQGPLAGVTPGVSVPFVTQTRLEEEGRRVGVPVPVGRWRPEGDGLVASRGGAANFLAIRYDAARVGVVASPPAAGAARLWALRDEAWIPPAVRGRDVAADPSGATYVEVREPGLVLAIEHDRGVHVLRLSPDRPGLTLHALTFDSPAAERR